MAYILRSNSVAIDDGGKFSYYSRYGVTHKEIAILIQDMDLLGYEVDEGEFSALDEFVTTLKSALLWDKVYEVYPLIGNSLSSSLVKLKSKNEVRVMNPVDGFSNAHLEFSNGKVIGKQISNPTTQGNAPRVNTGLFTSDLGPGVGFHSYCGNAQGSLSYMQPVIGAVHTASVTAATTQLAMNTGDQTFRSCFRMNPSPIADGYTNDVGVLGFLARPNPDFIGTSVFREYYFNGSLAATAVPQLMTSEASVELSLFGRNAPFTTNGAGTSTGYSGIVRFACVTDGYWTPQQVNVLHDAISQLMISLGKSA